MRPILRGVLAGTVLAGLVCGGAVAAQAIAPEAVPVPVTATLPVTAAAPILVCPGPETLVVPEGAAPIDPAGPIVVSAVSDDSATLGLLVPAAGGAAPAPSDPQALRRTGEVWLGSRSRATAGGVRLDAGTRGSGRAAGAAALQATLGATGDLRGLAAASCTAASSDIWLVGAGTAEGERARLLLANPTPAAALLDVFVHGPSGRVKAPAGEGIVVPSGRQIAVFVDALAPDAGEIAVHVATRSGRVVAALHHTRLRGFTPGGVDDVTAAAAPARSQVVPGVVVAAHGTSFVRVAVPGTAEAVVRVSLIGPDGTVAGAGAVLGIPGGGVRDVALTGVADGSYSAVVAADVPVVAGAFAGRTVAGGELAGTSLAIGKVVPPSELAWAPSTLALRGAVSVALPRLPAVNGVGPVAASLVVAAPTHQARFAVREVTAAGAIGTARVVTVAEGRSVAIPVTPGTAALLVRPPGEPGSGGPVFASVVLATQDGGGPMLSVVPVRPGPAEPGAPPRVLEDPRMGLR
jgi:hypothetical protein